MSMWINVCTTMYLLTEAHESWPVNKGAHCQRPHDRLPPFEHPLHLMFDMNSRTFEMLHLNIELILIIASNTKRRRNVVLMFGQRHRQ